MANDLDRELVLEETTMGDLVSRLRHIIEVTNQSNGYTPASPSDIEEMSVNIRWANENRIVDPVFHISSVEGPVGAIKKFIKRSIRKILTWYIRNFVNKQNMFNSNVVGYLNGEFNLLRQMEERLARLESLESDNSTISKHDLGSLLSQISKTIQHFSETYNTLLKKVDDDVVTKTEIEGYRDQILRLQTTALMHGSHLSEIVDEIHNLRKTVAGVYEQLNDVSSGVTNSMLVDFDYLAFENAFRGDEQMIQDRQRLYTRFINLDGLVLDLGCGRGEFLSLLLEEGFHAIGVEMNNEMYSYCWSRGLPVIKRDMFEYLASLTGGTVAAVSLNQVVEHLQPTQLTSVIKEAHRVLKEGGVLLMETQNPRTLAIYNGGFYIDPTHVKPVHPLTLEFLCKALGFSDVHIHYFSPLPDEYKFPHIVGEIDNISEVNSAIDRLNDTLYGFQDYVVVAVK